MFYNLFKKYKISKVYTNHDYEAYARDRDIQIKNILGEKNIELLEVDNTKVRLQQTERLVKLKNNRDEIAVTDSLNALDEITLITAIHQRN